MRHQTDTDHRYVDLDELACPGCGDQVADGRDGFTHDDGTALCEAGPVEVTR